MRKISAITWALAILYVVPVYAQVSVLTQHNDNARTGANLQETTLTVANVNNANFGKLAFRLVDGDIYAQPLIVSHAKGPAGDDKTIAIVATENNSVYAFDADNVNQASNAQLWQKNLAPAIDYHDLYNAIGAPFCSDITLQIGITSTPAILLTGTASPRTGVVFVTAKSSSGANFVYNLYALDLASGNLLGKVPIEGKVAGQGIGSTGSGAGASIAFNPLYQLNRPALTLAGNTLYVAFGGHCDTGPYHGWVFAYDVSNPASPKNDCCILRHAQWQRTHSEHASKEGLGGIWMSGEGLAVDESGNVYVATGNGTFNGTTDFSDSVLKMQLQGGQLRVLDFFTPQDQVELKDDDYDLGSGGVVLIPNSHLAIAGGKEGRMYLLDRNNLGKGTGLSLQSLQVTHDPVPENELGYNIHGAAVIWPRTSEMYIYLMGEEEHLKQFRLVPDPTGAGWRLDPEAPFKMSPVSAPYPDFPNGEFSPRRT